ncbi:hypothetical protein Aduo_003291 [Ancylostoma duodenale]
MFARPNQLEFVCGHVPMKPSAQSILLLCASPLLAADCPGSVISPEIKEQIITYHDDRRERRPPVEWDCNLEEDARSKMSTDFEKFGHPEGRGYNFLEIKKENGDLGATMFKALEYWWTYDLKSEYNENWMQLRG